MKVTQLKEIVKDSVREVIQEELREILLEAVKSNKQPIQEYRQPVPMSQPAPPPSAPASQMDRAQIRESYMNVLGDMRSNVAAGQPMTTQGLQVNGPVDTSSPNGKLPDGEVSLDQVMGLMNK